MLVRKHFRKQLEHSSLDQLLRRNLLEHSSLDQLLRHSRYRNLLEHSSLLLLDHNSLAQQHSRSCACGRDQPVRCLRSRKRP